MAGARALLERFLQHWWQVLSLLGLIFLGYPLRVAIESGPWTTSSMITYVGVALFAAGFTILMCVLRPVRLLSGPATPGGLWLRRGLIIGLVVLLALLVQLTNMTWLSLFFHVGVAIGVMLAAREAYLGLALLAVVIIVLGWPYDLSFLCLPTGLLGLWASATVNQSATVAELTAARRRLADLAVAEERLRFARDLHDLLGHSLSLISLKTELSGRLIESDPGRARAEIQDAHDVARRSLREVREAVSGYRRPTLPTELDGALEMLESAGVAARVDDRIEGTPVRHGEVLAWAIREAITNVVRHSGARTCTIELDRVEELICLTVSDDGHGASEPDLTTPGSGLSGVAERVRQVAGATVATENLEPGFRLRVCVPVGQH